MALSIGNIGTLPCRKAFVIDGGGGGGVLIFIWLSPSCFNLKFIKLILNDTKRNNWK